MIDPVTKGQLVAPCADSQMLLLIIAICMAVFVCIATASMRQVDLHEYDDAERTDAVLVEEAEAKS